MQRAGNVYVAREKQVGVASMSATSQIQISARTRSKSQATSCQRQDNPKQSKPHARGRHDKPRPQASNMDLQLISLLYRHMLLSQYVQWS